MSSVRMYGRVSLLGGLYLRKRQILHPYATIRAMRRVSANSCPGIRGGSGWKRSLSSLVREDSRYDELGEVFFGASLEPLFSNSACVDPSRLTLMCVVKNDLARMRVLLAWYRSLGVRQFAVLDDGSTDGTREFLLTQSDVDVFTSDVSYTTMTRQAWLARLVDFYGFGRWYLAVDSDELLTYEGCEEKDIDELIAELEAAGAKSGRAILLDMYGRGSLYDPEGFDEANPYAGIEYFDPDGIKVIERMRYFGVAGGMRARVFGQMPTLTKHPLFFAEPGFVPCHSHYSYPYEYNDGAVYIGVLRHYKFLPTDRSKYAERAAAGTFCGGSVEYKGYEKASSEDAVTPYVDGLSCRYVDSSSLSLLQLPEGFDNRADIAGRW